MKYLLNNKENKWYNSSGFASVVYIGEKTFFPLTFFFKIFQNTQ